MSFSQYFLTSGRPAKFIGLQNWKNVIVDQKFWSAFLITMKIVIPALIFEFVIGFFIALLLNRKLKGRGLMISLLATPVMIAPATAGLAFRLLYSPKYGPFNDLLSRIAGQTVIVDWLGSPKLAVYAITAVDIWQQTPFIMLVLLAGLSAVPDDIYEAAKIDGGTALQIFRYITLPLLKAVITVALLIRSIDLLKFFDLVFILTMGGPASSTETVSFYSYLVGIRFFRVGYGAAVSFVILAIAVILSNILLKIMKHEEQIT
jgi:multiple sugar transport system permease protein